MKLIWRCLKLTVVMIFIAGMIILGFTAVQIARFKKEEPLIIANESLVFSPGSEIELSDIATFKNCSDPEITRVRWEGGTYEKLTLMSGGRTIIVGDRKGRLIVTIWAAGESRDISCDVYLTIE
ncbi:hypothetical protein [uncultured Ruminococcus sp.]|uniref:hypothetical protein n=1 Tax=uncultured Ruminococcus sp. TaxID=165186 RepID=UPI00260FCD9F|nr:hypothetical protein [uncultured Ruminococcus sp.]